MGIFGITFDRNKLEICGFHRSKEQMKLHRIIHVRLSLKSFPKDSSQIFQKQNIESHESFENLIFRSTLESSTKVLQNYANPILAVSASHELRMFYSNSLTHFPIKKHFFSYFFNENSSFST